MPELTERGVPRSNLAKSAADHQKIGSSHGQSRPPADQNKPEHEFMSDEELRAYIEGEIETVRETRKKLGQPGGLPNDMYLMIRDDYLMANLKFLKEIQRLPEGIDIEALETEFQF